jgi:hypothetical protein
VHYGPIAHALIQGYLGPDQRVTNMERFFTALMQALHAPMPSAGKTAARLNRLNDSQQARAGQKSAQPIAMRRGFARSAFGKTKVIIPSRNSAVILSWSMIPEIRKLRR